MSAMARSLPRPMRSTACARRSGLRERGRGLTVTRRRDRRRPRGRRARPASARPGVTQRLPAQRLPGGERRRSPGSPAPAVTTSARPVARPQPGGRVPGQQEAEQRQHLQRRAARRSAARAGRRRPCSSRRPAGPGRRRATPTRCAPTIGMPPPAWAAVSCCGGRRGHEEGDAHADRRDQHARAAATRRRRASASRWRSSSDADHAGSPPRSATMAAAITDQTAGVQRRADVEVAGRAERGRPGDEHHLDHERDRRDPGRRPGPAGGGPSTKVSSHRNVNE